MQSQVIDEGLTRFGKSFLSHIDGLRLLLALFLSVSLWIIVTNGRNPDRTDLWQQPIPIEKQGVPGGYAVVGQSLGTVKLRIAAPEQTWQRLSLTGFRAYVDLSSAPVGLSNVPVKVDKSDANVNIQEILPPTVPVRLEKLESKTVPVRVNVQGAVPFGFQSGKAVPSQETVTVTGPTSVAANVVSVDAIVRIDGKNTTQMVNAHLVPKNSQGGDVPDPEVSISPQTLEVTVPIEQQITYKPVPIVVQSKGSTADGYQVTGVTVDPTTTTVLGSPTLLGNVANVQTEVVDIQGASADVIRAANVVTPKGVSLLQDIPVQVRITIAPVQGTATFLVTPRLLGVSANLRSTTAMPPVSVTVQGAVSRLRTLEAKNIGATVDATGLGPGSYDVAVSIQLATEFTAARVDPARVTVVLLVPPTPTSTPTPTPVPTFTSVPTATPTSTRVPTMTATPAVSASATTGTSSTAGPLAASPPTALPQTPASRPSPTTETARPTA